MNVLYSHQCDCLIPVEKDPHSKCWEPLASVIPIKKNSISVLKLSILSIIMIKILPLWSFAATVEKMVTIYVDATEAYLYYGRKCWHIFSRDQGAFHFRKRISALLLSKPQSITSLFQYPIMYLSNSLATPVLLHIARSIAIFAMETTEFATMQSIQYSIHNALNQSNDQSHDWSSDSSNWLRAWLIDHLIDSFRWRLIGEDIVRVSRGGRILRYAPLSYHNDQKMLELFEISHLYLIAC